VPHHSFNVLQKRIDVKALKRFHGKMKRATVYFEEDIHKALKVKAAEVSTSVSDLVNRTIRDSLQEDLEDLEAFHERENEPTIDFEKFLKQLKKDGKL
jgi:histidinol dehydrogenase